MDRDTVIIPNLAIHMNRNINEEGYKYNAQKDLLPFSGMKRQKELYDTDCRSGWCGRSVDCQS